MTDNEVDKAMEEIYKKWEAAEEEQVTGSENKKRKIEMDRVSAEEVRLKGTEKIEQNEQEKQYRRRPCQTQESTTNRRGKCTIPP